MAMFLLLSVKFSVNPWQMLILGFISVAMLLLLSVKFRVNPWQMLMPLLVLNSVSRA